MGKKKALEPLNCPQCGGAVDLDDNQEYGFCKYCGTKVINTYSVKQKEGNQGPTECGTSHQATSGMSS